MENLNGLQCPYCKNDLTDFFRNEYSFKQWNNDNGRNYSRNNFAKNTHSYKHLNRNTKIIRYGQLIGICEHCKCGITIIREKLN